MHYPSFLLKFQTYICIMLVSPGAHIHLILPYLKWCCCPFANRIQCNSFVVFNWFDWDRVSLWTPTNFLLETMSRMVGMFYCTLQHHLYCMKKILQDLVIYLLKPNLSPCSGIKQSISQAYQHHFHSPAAASFHMQWHNTLSSLVKT